MKRNTLRKTLQPKERQLMEIDYPQDLIKRITPYLDTVTYKAGDKTRRPNIKQRCYAWYYCFNGSNKSDAYRRAYYSSFHKGRRKLIPNDNLNPESITSGGYNQFIKGYVKDMIDLIRKDIASKIKEDVPQTILEQLKIQASYDPAMFITADGSPAFKNWEEIPLAYRCCVEGIESTRYGKNGSICETKIKLVNRATARKELMALAPDLLIPNKTELIHKTLDANGEEVGLDYSRLSDKELKELIKAE